MDPQPDVIRQQIDQTRESLTAKVEAVERQVMQTVDTVKTKVEDTVEAVSGSVQRTVAEVRRTFDLPYQTRRHPHAIVGGALLLGTGLGYWLARARPPRRRPPSRSQAFYAPPAPPPAVSGEARPARQESGPSFLGRLLEPVASEMDKIKATAIGAFLGLVRDAAVRSVPPALAPRIEEIINDVTRRAGGDVIREPLLPPSGPNGSQTPTRASV
jgi:hypothetical protein